MSEFDTDLLIGKILHDFASPIAANNNGLELFDEQDEEEFKEQALQISKDSSQKLYDMVKFYRILYTKETNLTLSEIVKLAKEFLTHVKLDLVHDHMGINDVNFSPKLLANFIYIISLFLSSKSEFKLMVENGSILLLFDNTAVQNQKVYDSLVKIANEEELEIADNIEFPQLIKIQYFVDLLNSHEARLSLEENNAKKQFVLTL